MLHNFKAEMLLRYMVGVLGRNELLAPMKTDNSTAYTFIWKTILANLSKIWDMRCWSMSKSD